jgi:hypothetical protein
MRRVLFFAFVLAACRPIDAAVVRRTPSASTAAPALTGASSAAPEARSAMPSEPPPVVTTESTEVAFDADRAIALMQLGKSRPAALACLSSEPQTARIRCLLRVRFEGDPRAAELALALYDELGDVVGLEVEHHMDGGWRGPIHIVPELPIGPHRRHLEWLLEARRAIDRFFVDLGRDQPSAPRYRYKPLALLFMRSVGKRTPSAYASNWTIGYNVVGSLHVSPDAVRETMFHEIFHLDDHDHGDWSTTALAGIYDGIMKRCRVEAALTSSIPCLRPYAPTETTVIGGTYYAFQPGNGVVEYAAELATRYYREQLAVLRGRRLPRAPFKCGPDENRRAWKLLVDEFFAGIDRVPGCP